jgi:citrate synthase
MAAKKQLIWKEKYWSEWEILNIRYSFNSHPTILLFFLTLAESNFYFYLNMKYQGTKIDGPSFNPENLSVRGTDLNTIISERNFTEAVFHILTGTFPSVTEHTSLEDFFLASYNSISVKHSVFEHIRKIAYATQSSIKGVITGLLFDLDDEFSKIYNTYQLPDGCSSRETVKGLFLIGILPLMLRIAADGKKNINEDIKPANAIATDSFIAAAFKTLFSRKETTAPEIRIFEALLISWHAGFGYLTPSVLSPRVVAGTGASANMIIMSGFIAAGPHHIGASEAAFGLITKFSSKTEQEITHTIEDLLLNKKIIPGFGHPLFKKDPRPDCLQSIWTDSGKNRQNQIIYNQVTQSIKNHSGLNPNIDFITAAILNDLGVTDQSLIPAIGLFARSIAMIAHADEKRQKPPFGAKSADARDFLANNQINELSFD